MERDTFRDSLWSALTPDLPPTPRLDGAARADVAVVGGGILGLSTALHLAESGVDVRLLEAVEPGFGASGRNTGFVVPSFDTAVDPESVLARLGADSGERLCRMILGAGERLFALIRRLGIDCDAEATGWLQPAHSPAKMRMLETRHAQWTRLGRPVRLLDRAEATRLSGSAGYVGAFLDPSGGQINSLAYVRGLASAAERAGARLHGQSPVAKIEPAASGWRLTTPAGVVSADRVILAANVGLRGLTTALARSLVPVTVYQVATQRLDDRHRVSILPERNCLSDTRRNRMAYRWSPDGRLITGGAAVVQAGALDRMPRYLLSRLSAFLPGAGPFTAAYVWRGVIGVVPDFLPKVYELGPGLHAALACNGRGIAMTTALGQELARFAAGGRREDLPVPITGPRPIALHGLVRRGPPFWLAWARCMDRWESRAPGTT